MNPSEQLRLLAANVLTVSHHGAGLSAADLVQHAQRLTMIADAMHKMERTLDEMVAESMDDARLRDEAINTATVLVFPQRPLVGHDWTKRQEYKP